MANIRAVQTAGTSAFAAVIDRADRSQVIWGSFIGEAPHILVTAARTYPVLGHIQAYFESGIGVSTNKRVAFSVGVPNRPEAPALTSVPGYLDSCWRYGMGMGQSIIAREGREIQLPEGVEPLAAPQFWGSISQVGLTGGGAPYFLASQASTAGGVPAERAVYLHDGILPVRVLGTGHTLANEEVIAAWAGIRRFSFTSSGSKLLAIVGVGNRADGSAERLVRYSISSMSPPAEVLASADGFVMGGFFGEQWKGFRDVGIIDSAPCMNSGKWFAVAQTTAGGDQSSVILVNNQIIARQGSTIGNLMLYGPAYGAALNNNGDFLMGWATKQGSSGTPRSTLFLNGQNVIRTPVTTADGQTLQHIYPGFTLSGRDSGGYVHIYFRGKIGDHVALLSARMLVGAALCCPADLDDDGDFFNGGHPDQGVDINDLLFFLAGFEMGSLEVDLDDDGDPAAGTPDQGVDINDLLFFLARFEAGC